MTMVNSYAPVLISGATLRTLFIESVPLRRPLTNRH